MQDPTDLTDEHEALVEFWEKVDLILYLVVIAVMTPAVTRMIGAGWESNGIVRTSVYALEGAIGVSHAEFKLFCLGAYGALVGLLLLDEMKRMQGVLLAVASAIALWVFRSQGLLYPVDPIAHAPAIGAGLLVAFVLGGGLKLRTDLPPYEFRRATAALFWVVTIIVALGFLEKHIVYPTQLGTTSAETGRTAALAAEVSIAGNQLFSDALASATFLAGAYMFTSYEAKTRTFVMGVQRAGKTLLGAALYMAADDEADTTRLNPSEPMSQLVSSLRAAEEGWGTDEYTGPTGKGEYYLLDFQTRAGSLFKEYVEVDVLDYAGEYIDGDLVERVADSVPRSRLSLNYLVYMYESIRGLPSLPESATNLGSDEIQRVMTKQIIHSDTLVIIVDSGSLMPELPYGEDDYEAQVDLSEYLNSYVQILRHVNESVLAEKEVVLVATKADYLYRLYHNSSTHLTFFNWVNYHMLESPEGKEKLGPLLNQAQVDRVYPVYYDLDHGASLEAEEPVPEHPLEIHGNENLLNRLKEGT